ncbi:MAG: hypothetical protein L6Q76_34570, partial [Polyangiaceae bacterium]|nr:hypothetical protein [Polyangiaceae bacterium]
MMNAVISGSAGVALLVDGDRLSSIDVGALEEVVPRSSSEVRLLFGDSGDLQFYTGLELEEVKSRLTDACGADDALHLALILLDPEVPADIQEEAAGELSELLLSERVRERLESILYAKPLPDCMDVSGAIRCCRGGVEAHERSAELLERLRDRQGVIREVRDAWEAIPASILSGEERPAAEGVVARAGLNRSLVLARMEGENMDAWL